MKAKPNLKIFAAVLLAAALAVLLFIGRRHTDYTYIEQNGFAMGTVVSQKLYGGTAEDAAAVEDAVSDLEQLLSRHLDGSAVSALNRAGSVDAAALAETVSDCLDVCAASGGAFDVTVGALSDLWDFDGGGHLPDAADIAAALETVGYASVAVSGDAVTLGAGQKIDLGAAGKGAACDAARAYLEESGVRGAVVSVGGSVLVYGARNRAGDKWRVAIRHPRKNDEFLGVVTLASGCVSTSGDYEKFFEEGGVRYHHILDPKTGYPAESGLISVTVVCESGLLSDALSTACFVLGKEQGAALVERFGAGAVFVDADLRITTVGNVEFSQ